MGIFRKNKEDKDREERKERRAEMKKYARQARGVYMPNMNRLPKVSSRE